VHFEDFFSFSRVFRQFVWIIPTIGVSIV